MTTNESKLKDLIHIGKVDRRYRFLRRLAPQHFGWFQQEPDGSEIALNVTALSIEEALRLANRVWRLEGFQMMNCGFRYTLPERDEHGSNALFYQMVASLQSPNGVYFDDELGGNCIVHFASLESRTLMQQLKT